MRAILTFHSIDEKDSVISCSPRYFSLLLETLAARDLPVLDLDTLLAPATTRGVSITFDDGMRSVYDNALPVLRDYNAPAHVFVATAAIDSDRRWPYDSGGLPDYDMMGWDELAALHEAKVSIECHTHTHPDMRTLSTQQLGDECNQADELISARLGRRPDWFAYPYGYHNPAVRDFARERYRGSVTTELRSLAAREDSAALPRLDSYYLQSEWRIRHIDSLPVQTYLATRNVLRNLRGSQCAATCN